MKTITVKAALQSKRPKRTRPYKHVVGKFLLTASFRDSEIDHTQVQLAAALAKHFTQRQISDMLGVSASVVSKLIRIHAAYHG